MEDLYDLDISVVSPTDRGHSSASSFVLLAARNAALLFDFHLTDYLSDIVLRVNPSGTALRLLLLLRAYAIGCSSSSPLSSSQLFFFSLHLSPDFFHF